MCVCVEGGVKMKGGEYKQAQLMSPAASCVCGCVVGVCVGVQPRQHPTHNNDAYMMHTALCLSSISSTLSHHLVSSLLSSSPPAVGYLTGMSPARAAFVAMRLASLNASNLDTSTSPSSPPPPLLLIVLLLLLAPAPSPAAAAAAAVFMSCLCVGSGSTLTRAPKAMAGSAHSRPVSTSAAVHLERGGGDNEGR